MKTKEKITQFTTTELKERLDAERMHLSKMKLNHAISPIENPNKIKQSRRTIARMLTELRKREIEAAKTAK